MLRLQLIKFSLMYQANLRMCIKPLVSQLNNVNINQVNFKTFKTQIVDLSSPLLYSILHHDPNAMVPHTKRNYSGYSMSANEAFRNLDYNQLIEQKENNSNIVIDVREKHELDSTGVIPGSHHIPLGEIEIAFKTPPEEFHEKYNFKKPTTEDHIIFSCRSGKRSLVALEKALGQGFKYAKHYTGGWLDWEQKSSEPK